MAHRPGDDVFGTLQVALVLGKGPWQHSGQVATHGRLLCDDQCLVGWHEPGEGSADDTRLPDVRLRTARGPSGSLWAIPAPRRSGEPTRSVPWLGPQGPAPARNRAAYGPSTRGTSVPHRPRAPA